MTADPLLSAALRHWGTRAVPFSDSAGEKPCPSPAWEANLALLGQTAALRSLMLLCGDNGVGKSALVGHWLGALEPKAYCPVVITQATLGGSGLLAVLLGKLGQKPGLHRSRNLARLEEALKDLGRVTPILVLDDAQDYPPGALEEVRLLLGLNLPRQPVFALVLIGDLYLQETLRLAHHRPLYSRIAARGQLAPLDRAAVEAYLVHGLHQVGLQRPCLAPAAIDLLAGASSGVPRLLNLLARWAWIAAARAQANSIEAEHVQAALPLVPAAADKLRV
jgi:Type II secretory pathway, component ExeA (predicted ATPase)